MNPTQEQYRHTEFKLPERGWSIPARDSEGNFWIMHADSKDLLIHARVFHHFRRMWRVDMGSATPGIEQLAETRIKNIANECGECFRLNGQMGHAGTLVSFHPYIPLMDFNAPEFVYMHKGVVFRDMNYLTAYGVFHPATRTFLAYLRNNQLSRSANLTAEQQEKAQAFLAGYRYLSLPAPREIELPTGIILPMKVHK